MINVTQTFLPPIEEYQKNLQKAWDKKWITNRGELVKELEAKIQKKGKTTNLLLTSNGTLPLQLAIKALNLKGEIITTPFSYIATSAAIVWENCTPIFADIDPNTFNIDVNQIEGKITSKTSAIIATHVFGNPCNIESINTIAKKNNLKVIYDAAHCFGVEYNNQSIFNFGDISTCSFHATKIFHTGEGGAIFSKDKKLFETLFNMHNFGHKGKENFHGIGINAKMSELQAAMGLTILPYFDKIKEARKDKHLLYKSLLKDKVAFQKIENCDYNYSYMPILLKNENSLKKVEAKLNENHIFPRRYFYPSLNTIDYLNGCSCPVSEDISKRILCLPLFKELENSLIQKIAKIIMLN